jgi:chromosome segregation ATPase
MSEERFDRIEAQISELREMMQQNMTAMQQDITATKQDITMMKQDITATKQNLNALSEDVVALRHRMDSIEGTVVVTMREGFESFRSYLDDLNYDLANNERRTRRLSRRVSRLEKDEDK